ncbi:MAG: EAL domain-containing protein [Burkholderiales bacterium]|jgi:EAL domain-containing protein (putative c-di-GMP-specific phosphodiesterase class I)|nr:EAL domain-containing protein [Burkholderiales bacterium]
MSIAIDAGAAFPSLPGPGASGPERKSFLMPLVASGAGWHDPAGRLDRALSSDDFVLHARRVQPLARTAPRTHFEVLLRFSDEERSHMPPGTFLSVLETHGLMPRLDEWVVAKVLYWRALFAGNAEPVFIVRLSPSALRRAGFVESVTAEIARYCVPASLFCFELAEDEALALEPAARAALAAMRRLGCGVSIGSFGQRPESLRLLQKLQATVVKIDGDLGRRAVRDASHAARVGAIARACSAMGILSIAESVETIQSRKALARAGVDCAQGPALRPIVEELVELTYGPA